MASDEAVRARIASLLSKRADRGATIEEQYAAERKAAELIEKHGFDRADFGFTTNGVQVHADGTASIVNEDRTAHTVYRHRLIVRITHWVNAVCILFLLMSGLQIFNAHPHLYWGDASTFDAQNIPTNTVLSIGTLNYPDGRTEGFIRFFGGDFITTTGFLGYSQNTGDLWTTVGNDLRDWGERIGIIAENDETAGAMNAIGFPSWMTLPSWRDLAAGRLWHFLFAWIFVINLAVYLAYGVFARHFWRDFIPTWEQWRGFGRTVWDHIRLRFPRGEEAAHYNILQKLAYGVVVLALIVMIMTGLSMSPGMNAAAPWLPELFGGRQSARTFHFISATIIVLFFVVHIVMVLVSGVWNNLRSIITGRYRIKPERVPK